MGTQELSETAYLIAWGRSTDPELSLDPYAHLWLTKRGIQFSERFAEHITPHAPYFYCLRSRYLVEQLRGFEREFPGFTLINIGSGLTSYPFLLSEHVSAVCFDQPHVLDVYREKVERAVDAGDLPERKITYMPVDLNSHEGIDAVGRVLSAQKQPCFVLFEGILTYLDKAIAMELVRACSERMLPGSKMVVHVALQEFISSVIWKKVEKYLVEELSLPAPRLTFFDEKELMGSSTMKLIEHVGFMDIQGRLGLQKNFSDDEFFDERFFLFQKK